METQFYTPEDPESFLRNLEKNYRRYPKQITNMNGAPSKERNAHEDYHVINASVRIRMLTRGHMVKITAFSFEEKEKAKSFLEKIAGKFEGGESI